MTTKPKNLQRSRNHPLADVTQKWFLSEPLLFAAWTTHDLVPNASIGSIRVGAGRIEYNPKFVSGLSQRTLAQVMEFEAIRIILKHPYERRKPNLRRAWQASNLAIAEATQTGLPMPTAESVFNTAQFAKKHFEFYYDLLTRSDTTHVGQSANGPSSSIEANNQSAHEATHSDGKADGFYVDGRIPSQKRPDQENVSQQIASPENTTRAGLADKASDCSSGELLNYCHGQSAFLNNTQLWREDALACEQINEIIAQIESSQSWGTVGGKARELILANQRPRLDYRNVLRSFRASILSSQRRLTRMKPSRRYGFQYMGSRHDFSTQLLFAVDVSGSVKSDDVSNAFSIVNRLFKYGVESIDVIWFDTQIQNPKPDTIRQARRKASVTGRGGTDFQPLMDYLDIHPKYDGLIIFTDGHAPIPSRPKRNRHTQVVWLFDCQENWSRYQPEFQSLGMLSAFVYDS